MTSVPSTKLPRAKTAQCELLYLSAGLELPGSRWEIRVNSGSAIQAKPSLLWGDKISVRFLTVLLPHLLAISAPFALVPMLSAEGLQLAIAEADITPKVTPNNAVWMAGYYHGRAAEGVHDSLFARGILLSDGQKKIAIVSLDLIGWSYPSTQRIRSQLPQIDYVLICSTHSHEGPDTIGIWGESPIKRGVNEEYNERVEKAIVELVRSLTTSLQPATARFATIDRPDLLQDSRLPVVIDPTLRVIQFLSTTDGSPMGMLVQGTAHPEALGAKNKQITADFPYFTQRKLRAEYDCPTVYVSGAIGGLLAPPEEGIHDTQGNPLHPGNFEYAEAYGNEVAQAIITAISTSQPIRLTPFAVDRQEVAIPIDNPLYRLARSLNVIRRVSYQWTGNPRSWGKQVTRSFRPQRAAAVTEVAVVTLGELHLLAIPGELYPELVTGEIPEPALPNVDFPDAPIEPNVEHLMRDQPWMLMGLANDEIGYILPKRQWDREPPYAYERSMPQYGEINSCSPEAGPIIMQTLAELCSPSTPPEGS